MQIQIVIDIPEESFKAIKNKHFAFDDNINDLFYWIANGTPLPKGHGDLIDRNDLSLMTVHLIDGIFVCDAPTIIGADNTESEE